MMMMMATTPGLASVLPGVLLFLLVAATSAAAASSPIEQFQACIASSAVHVLYPGNSSFEAAADACWNTAWTLLREPAAVAQPVSAAQVRDLVLCANAADLRFAIRGGGHSYEAMSLINGGLVIDLGGMDNMTLAPGGSSNTTNRSLMVGPGARVGPVYAFLFRHGLMIEGATCPSVGISGLTLGGGTGHSTRRIGLLSDLVLSAEVVTASGDLLNISANSSHSDLFWAIRGGGANYAIVTRWQFQVFPYPAQVSYGSLEWPPNATAQLLQAFSRWQPWLLPPEVARTHIAMYNDKVMLEVYTWTPLQRVEELLASLPWASAGLPPPSASHLLAFDWSSYMLSTSVTNCYGEEEGRWSWSNISSTAAVQRAEQAWRSNNTGDAWPFHGGSAVFLAGIPDELLTAFAAQALPRITNASSFTRAVMIAAGGAQRSLNDRDAGFGWRNMTMQLEIGTEARSGDDAKSWVAAVLGTLMPATKGRRFYNHFECLDTSEDRPWQAYFGEHADRLLAIKRKYDAAGRLNGMNCSALSVGRW